MSLFDPSFGKSPPPESLPVTPKEPRREEPAESPPAPTLVVVPPDHTIVQVAVPDSLVPSIDFLKGGVCVASLGQGSDEPVEELESLLHKFEPWMKDPRRLSLVSLEQGIPPLFGPSPSAAVIPRLVFWVFSKRALCGWLQEPVNLQALLRHLYRLNNSEQPLAQCVFFEHDCGPSAAVMARLLVGLGLNVRMLDPNDPQRILLVEVHRPDGNVIASAKGRRFELEGAVDDFLARVNAEKAQAEAGGDAPRLRQLEQQERDYLVREIQPLRSHLYELPLLRAPRLCRLLRTFVDHRSPPARQALERELLGCTRPLLLLMNPDGKTIPAAHFHGIGPALRVYPDHVSLLRTVKDLEMSENSYGISGMAVRDAFDWAAAKNCSLALNVYMTPYTPTYVFWLPEDARLLAQGQLTSRA